MPRNSRYDFYIIFTSVVNYFFLNLTGIKYMNKLKFIFGSLLCIAGLSYAIAACANLPYITDSFGRDLTMHGFSSSNSAKWTKNGMSWETQQDMLNEAKLTGASVVRMTIFWDLIEPVEGQYNDSYLADVAQRVAMYKKADIQVVLDMHQDLYGPYIQNPNGDGSVNGAPKWATQTDGLPVKTMKIWGLMYFQPGIERAFDHLWGVAPSGKDFSSAYANMWQHVAKYFSHNDNIVGYDIINEPFKGSTIWNAYFERVTLSNFYKKSIDSIRQVDPNKWIFLEPEAVYVNQAVRQSALVIPKDPRVGPPHIAYAPHEYILPMAGSTPFTGVNKLLAKAGVNIWFHQNYNVANYYHAPLWIGEFGAGHFTEPGFCDYVKYVLSDAIYYNTGWAYWATESMASPGDLALASAAMMSPYAKAVPGAIISNYYDADNKKLDIKWTPKKMQDDAPLLVYLPKSFYPKGYDVQSNFPITNTTWDANTDVLSVFYAENVKSLPAAAEVIITTK
jgi:endoglycosylceramidase